MPTVEYRGARYDQAEFDRQFNPRLMAVDPEAVQPRRVALSEAIRERYPHKLGIPYGDRRRETIDAFPAASPAAPVVVYIHGGYWRMGSARENNYFAAPFLDAGACVFLINYDLCPTVRLGTIVDQARNAINWIHAHAAEYGGDANKLCLVGHSAGAHLIAMALAEDGALPFDAIVGAALIGGIYDLDPVLRAAVNADIGLAEDDVAPFSALRHPPAAPVPMIVSVGTAESEEWIRQSRLYEAVAKDAGCPVERVDLEGGDHYQPLFDMANPAHPLTKAIMAMIAR